MMNKYEKSAVIGYWRSGATSEQICVITGFCIRRIKKLVFEYQKEGIFEVWEPKAVLSIKKLS